MVVRLSPIVGLLGLAAIFGRLTRLLRPSLEGVDWYLVLGASVLVGMLVAFALSIARAKWPMIALGTAVAALGVVLRLSVPDTLRFGILPTRPTWEPLGAALSEGWEQVRFGTAPIHPSMELLLVLIPVFVILGAVWSAATHRRVGWLAVAGIGWFYLLLSVVDRTPPGVWTVVMVAWTALALLGVTVDGRANQGRVLGRPDHRIATWASIAAMAGAFVLTALLSPSVPASGIVPWRDASTLGGIRTGVSYNLFASTIQDQLIAGSDTPVFEALVGRSPVAPADTYWRLITLDRYDGVNWLPTPQQALVPTVENEPFESAAHRFRGPTEQVLAVVRIAALRQNFLPFTGSPTDIDSNAPLLQSGYRVRPDAAIRLDGLTRRGLEYTLTTDVPAVDALDLATSLSATEAPVLRQAATRGLLALSGDASRVLPDLPDRGAFLQLPFDLDTRIGGLAEAITRAAEAPLERALLLEAWFRQDDLFAYSVDIEAGHGASALVDWLVEPNSPNYHVGYCEQFATAMAVMARTVNLPSRVVIGFTPGDVAEDGLITVREKNAHAWVEIWLDGVGWVGFDPTPRGDGANPATGAALGFDILAIAETIELPEPTENEAGLAPIGDAREGFFEGEEATPDALDGGGFAIPGFSGEFSLTIPAGVRWLLGALLLIGLIPVAKRLRRFIRIQRAKRGDISAAWAEITDQLRDMGHPITAAMTPREVTDRVGASLLPLTRAHEQNEYGPEPPTRAQRVHAIEALTRTEAGFKGRPLPDRLIKAWRVRSFRKIR